MSRSCLYIHKDIKYERLNDLEPMFTSVIAIELGLKYQKKFTLIQWYRQWQLLNGIEIESDSHEKQMERLVKVINMWKELCENKEVHLIGDINLDYMNNTDCNKQKLIDVIEEEILQTGTKKIELGNTFFRKNCERALDHIYSNNTN